MLNPLKDTIRSLCRRRFFSQSGIALGTVADVVPLVDENHIFVRAGLEILSPTQVRQDASLPVTDQRKAGIRALQAAALVFPPRLGAN